MTSKGWRLMVASALAAGSLALGACGDDDEGGGGGGDSAGTGEQVTWRTATSRSA
jgi:hypothetical protein